MKRKMFWVLSLMIMLVCINVYGDTEDREKAITDAMDNTPVEKLVRGVTNTATFWLEIPNGIAKTTEETKNPVLGLTQGAAEGLLTGIGRLGTGAIDTVTFLMPPYDKPILEPGYVFEQKPGKGLWAQLKALDDKLAEYLW